MSRSQTHPARLLPATLRRSMRMLREFRASRSLKSAGGLALALCWTPQTVVGMSCSEDSRSLPVAIESDLSLVTDFWRSQFHGGTEGNMTSTDPDEASNSSGPRSPTVDSTSTMTEELVPEVGGDLPIATESETFAAMGVETESLAMSDWETAESQAGNLREKTLTKDGPSMVTAIVGIVGVIVVFGAYLKGKS